MKKYLIVTCIAVKSCIFGSKSSSKCLVLKLVVNCETRVCSDLGLKSLIDLNLMKMSVKCVNEMIVNKVRLLHNYQGTLMAS